jgi:hypothetical protein
MTDAAVQNPVSRKAVYGRISFGCFWAGAGLFGVCLLRMDDFIGDIVATAVAAAVSGGGGGGVSGWTVVWLGAYALWLTGLGAGVAGLVKKEQPRWPAVAGLVLCALPAAQCVFSLVTESVGRK